ncbi:hypothetical protein LTR62_005012 [Meristemomyces frigidus]|uniref:Uncharacterized protein n=1 Tax=Meristemomyces frigidus TaxID=1508187 RepID=A0AAN7TI44_9PEZI|nr:hypothetical protein LTR62_005012 [Meristemomyces frigidus]
MSCLTSTCSTAPQQLPTAINLSSLLVSYTPKKTYQCENSPVPGTNTDSPTLMLNGTGGCGTSPFDFLSLVAGPQANDAVVDRSCKLAVFPEQGCGGTATMVGLVDGAEECHFVSGRSARMVCEGSVEQTELVSLPGIAALCSANGTLSDNNTLTAAAAGSSETAYSPLYTTAVNGSAVLASVTTGGGESSSSTTDFSASGTGTAFALAPTTTTASHLSGTTTTGTNVPAAPPYTGSASMVLMLSGMGMAGLAMCVAIAGLF